MPEHRADCQPVCFTERQSVSGTEPEPVRVGPSKCKPNGFCLTRPAIIQARDFCTITRIRTTSSTPDGDTYVGAFAARNADTQYPVENAYLRIRLSSTCGPDSRAPTSRPTSWCLHAGLRPRFASAAAGDRRSNRDGCDPPRLRGVYRNSIRVRKLFYTDSGRCTGMKLFSTALQRFAPPECLKAQ